MIITSKRDIHTIRLKFQVYDNYPICKMYDPIGFILIDYI